MKKLLTSLMAIVYALLIVAPTSFAAETSFFHKAPTKIGVVIVGNSDTKTPDFFKYVQKSLTEEDNKSYVIESGTDVQSKYQNYWFNKGFLEEQKLTKDDLHAFVKYSGYDKVLFLVVSDPIMEKTKVPAGWFTTVEQTRASIETKAFFVDDSNIIKAVTVTKEDDSQASVLRAKRGAFQKCIKEIATELKDSLK